ncbi:MAG: putative FmdB family regulatory protein [Rhodothermales bacterium]|jgi:putative FmdB family regulatory protein
MPTYSYRREDGTTFDITQRITEDALATCPTTGQPVKRMITGGAGLVFKGTGFYQTDYARKETAPTVADSSESKGKETKGDSPAKPEKPSESKPAKKAD